MINRSEMKRMARSQIKGNIGVLFVAGLIINIILLLAAPVAFLLVPSFEISTAMIYLSLTQNVRPSAGDVWKGFGLFGKALWLWVITGFFVFLWSLVFVIPGIVKGYAYLMAPYILADNPDLTAREALRESKRITYGHKGELFVLSLSFFGWILLVPLTLGLITIWLAPYANATLANYYLILKADKQVTFQPLEQGAF